MAVMFSARWRPSDLPGGGHPAAASAAPARARHDWSRRACAKRYGNVVPGPRRHDERGGEMAVRCARRVPAQNEQSLLRRRPLGPGDRRGRQPNAVAGYVCPLPVPRQFSLFITPTRPRNHRAVGTLNRPTSSVTVISVPFTTTGSAYTSPKAGRRTARASTGCVRDGRRRSTRAITATSLPCHR